MSNANSAYGAFIFANSNNDIFTDALKNDLLIYTTNNKVLIGKGSNNYMSMLNISDQLFQVNSLRTNLSNLTVANLQASSVSMESVRSAFINASNASVGQINGCNVFLSNMQGSNVSLSNLITIQTIGSNATFSNLIADRGDIEHLDTCDLVAVNITTTNLLTAAYAHIYSLQVPIQGSFCNLVACNLFVSSNLTISKGLVGSNVTASNIQWNTAIGTTLTAITTTCSNINTSNLTWTQGAIGNTINMSSSVTAPIVTTSNLTTSNLQWVQGAIGDTLALSTSLLVPTSTTSNLTTSNLTWTQGASGSNLQWVQGAIGDTLALSTSLLVPTSTTSNLTTSNLTWTQGASGSTLSLSTSITSVSAINSNLNTSNLTWTQTAKGSTLGLTTTTTSNLYTSNITWTHGAIGDTLTLTSSLSASSLSTSNASIGTLTFKNSNVVYQTANLLIGSNLTLSNNGNVGIGSQTPVYKLDVGGDINLTGGLYLNGQVVALSTNGLSTFTNLTTTNATIANATITNATISKMIASAVSFSNSTFTIYSQSSNGLTITNNGFVGINNLNPLNPLDVSGSINFTGSLKSNGSPLDLSFNASNPMIGSNLTYTNSLIFYDKNAISSTASNSNVAITNGNLTVGNTLNVLGPILQNGVPFVSGSGTSIGSNGILATSNSTFSLIVNSNVLTLSSASNGYLGVAGNSNPKWSLDVAGSVNFTGSLFQNGSLYTPTSFSNVTASNLNWVGASGGSLNLNSSLVTPTTITSQIIIGGGGSGSGGGGGSFIGSSTNSLWVSSNLSVGSTASNLEYPFVVTDSGNAGVSAYFNGSILVQKVLEVSDIRVKKDIVPVAIDEARRAIKMIDVKKFDYIEDPINKTNNSRKRRVGFIAQELEKIIPECVSQVAEYIPNINTIGKVIAQNVIRLPSSAYSIIENGDLIKLYRGKTPIYATCTNVERKEGIEGVDLHVDIDLNFTSQPEEEQKENIFVYGTRVEDFKVISTEPILALLVKCVQSLL